jgi:two-component system, chemotaxis family, CheB/CheR fusion protein
VSEDVREGAARREPTAAEGPPEDLLRLLEHIKISRGFDFTGYKPASLQRRIWKRMDEVGVETYADYLDHLLVRPEEFPPLLDTLLINVTRFFRDAATWEHLRTEVIPRIVAEHDGGPVRVWSAGCATGEEAYSLAMVFAEVLGVHETLDRVKIYATDLDEQALSHARQASYSERETEGLDPELRGRYFEEVAGRHDFRGDLRRAVIFGRHDLVQDAPISRVSLLTCRNTLMYLNAETQSRVLQRLHFALRDDGFLVLGRAEMLLSQSHLFIPTDLSRRIFTKVADTGLRAQLAAIGREDRVRGVEGDGGHLELGLATFESNPVAELVVDPDGVLHLVNRKAAQVFDLGPTDVGRPFSDLELSYRPVELRSLLDRVAGERRSLTVGEVEWRRTPDDDPLHFDVRLSPVLDGLQTLRGVSISFRDVSDARRLQRQLKQAKRELDAAYEELQATNEELETTNEELHSTIEEQETVNEELQSANEELETTNEELQSTNAELQSINVELRERTAEVNEVNAFLESILASLDAGVAVVDADMVIEVWSELAEELWGIRPAEAAGQHLLNLDLGLPVTELRDPIRRCLADDGAPARLCLPAINRRGRSIDCEVRLTPMRRADGSIRGVILLMEEIGGA